MRPGEILFGLADIIKRELAEYSTETISLPKNDTSSNSSQSNRSYWREAFEMVGLNNDFERDSDSSTTIDTVKYWRDVKQIQDEDGNPKYFNLDTLALVILCLPHSNAEPERGFSVNKSLLDV